MAIIEIDAHQLTAMAQVLDLSRVAMPLMRDKLVRAGAEMARAFSIPKTPVSDGWMWKKGSGIVKRPSGKLKAAVAGGQGEVFKLNSSLHQFTFGVDGKKIPYAASIIADDNEHMGGPYPIRAKNKPYLCFAVSATQMVRKKMVIHPGGIALTGGGTGYALLTRAGKIVEGNGMNLVREAAKYLPLFK